uniref:ANK_REP_REGION domain-containing protein n=2 Tax=Macrostomum lignano TaxID=282301 RepID=A0A1I8IP47_9PLAT
YSSESVCVGLTDSAIEKQSTTDILEKIDILIAFGVDPLEENIAAQNFLHWAKLPQNLLKKLLTDFSESHGLKALYEKLDCGSNGLHLVHTYSRKYNLEVLLEPLSKLSDLKENRLLSLAVSKGDNKGATCFHFACEGGQTSSFRFLLKKGPNISVSIKTLTDSELSCIDFAIDRGHLEPVMKVYTEFEAKALQKKGIGSKAASNAARITLLRLVDPIKKAVSLPDRVAAQKALASIIDQLSDDSTACRKGRRGLQILERAITLNSTKLFRSALKMNFVNATTERLLPEFLRCQQHRNLELSVMNCLCMGDKIGRHGWVDAFSELSVIDITCSHSEHYDEILLDLVLTRQFELIPASINLLIRLGPEIDKLRSQARGKHATLQELYRKVQEIAVNSLEELFASATQKRQRELLFEFLQGRIESAEGVSGPKFPFRTLNKKIRHGAVTDMIEEADCNEIFATDCIYSLVQQEWKTGRRPCSPWYSWDATVAAITLPFNILFTNFEKLEFGKTLTNITIGKSAHTQGIGVFENLMLFLFMGLVNIVMLNLLIALFNLRVNRMANEALGIWRRTYFGMLKEYQNLSPVPPPLSFLWYIYDCFTENWWRDPKKYPEEYMDFLEFQANQLRRFRASLLSNSNSNSRDDLIDQLSHRLKVLEEQTQAVHEKLK